MHYLRWTVVALGLGGVGLGVRAAAPPAESLEQLWSQLGTDDPVKVDRVKARLVNRPAQTVPFLRQRLRPVTVDARQVRGWLADLDSDRYATRERASAALESLSDAVEPQLRQALSGKPSLEARRRIERLLKQIRRERLSPSSPHRRAVSAIEVLETIGDAAARQVLAALARGAPTAWLTIEAEAALERVGRK
jgi:hypothetical protein